MKRLITLLIRWLTLLAYGATRVDKLNGKMYEPVVGLTVTYNGKTRQLFKFVNESDIPSGRLVLMKEFEQERLMAVSRELLGQYIDAFKAALNAGDNSKIGALLYTLEDTNKNVSPVESLYNLATVMYFDEEEDLATWDADWNVAKKAAFKEHPDKRFFLGTLLKALSISGSQSSAAIVGSLLRDQVKLKAYAQIVSESSGKQPGNSMSKRSLISAKEGRRK